MLKGVMVDFILTMQQHLAVTQSLAQEHAAGYITYQSQHKVRYEGNKGLQALVKQ